jgi:photosystem II stability/assembly factor-like uncharacterized protein
MKRKILIASLLLLNCMIASAQSWDVQNTMFPNQYTGVGHISVPAAGVVWVTGYDGGGTGANYIDFSRTTDGGINWTPGFVGTDTNYNFCNIHALNADTAWVCQYNKVTSSGGEILRTNDGGATWFRQDTLMFTSSTSFADFVYFWTADSGVVIGDPTPSPNHTFEIYTTADGGTTWTRVPGANSGAAPGGTETAITDYFDVVGNTMWFTTTTGRLYKSTDRGYNWTTSVITTIAAGQGMTAKFLNDSNGISQKFNTTTGALVLTRVTTDGGTTWNTITPTGKFFTNDYGRVPGTHMYMSTGSVFATPGNAGTSYSLDYGLTWTTIDTIQHLALGAYDIDNVWTGGFNSFDVTFTNVGGAFKLVPADILGVKDQVNLKAEWIAYPNPSSGIVNMNFKIGKNVDVKASVVNLMGAEVYSENFSNVTIFKHSFDFSYLPKGIYLLNLEYNGDRATQKLIIQ